MGQICKSKDFAERCVMNLRCSGVESACVREIIVYEVITGKEVNDESS